jgi:DNA-binding CsgD family transcriptional regulator
MELSSPELIAALVSEQKPVCRPVRPGSSESTLFHRAPVRSAEVVMDSNHCELWERLLGAKRQFDSARAHLDEIKRGLGSMTSADGQYTHLKAVQAHELALTNFLRMLNEYKDAVIIETGAPLAATSAAKLTPREVKVLSLIAAGKTSKEIADHMGIAFKTVVCHRYRIQTKLNAHHTADLTRTAIRLGLAQL